MEDHTQEEISKAAYKIWIEEGQPEGKALEHWHRAQMAGIKKAVSENLPSPPQTPSPEDYG